MKKKAPGIKNALLFFLGSLALLLAICIGGNSLLRSRAATRLQLESELSRLPIFDHDTELQLLTAEYKINPEVLARNYPPRAELDKKVEQQLTAAIQKKYPDEALKADIDQITENVGIRSGKVIEVKYYNDMGGIETIKGIYLPSGQSNLVTIGGKGIKLSNIVKEYQGQFKVTEKSRNKQIDARKKEFAAERQKYREEHFTEVEHDVYTAAGYVMTSKKEWLSPKDFVERELELRKQKIETEYKEKIDSLFKKYKAWGIIPFSLKITNPKS